MGVHPLQNGIGIGHDPWPHGLFFSRPSHSSEPLFFVARYLPRCDARPLRPWSPGAGTLGE